MSGSVSADLTLVAYAYGRASFETPRGDVRLTIPLADWEELGRPADVRVIAEVKS